MKTQAYSDLKPNGRHVMVTAPRAEGPKHIIERDPLAAPSLLGRIGLLPTLDKAPTANMFSRFASTWRVFSCVGSRARQMPRAHHAASGKIIETDVTEYPHGRKFIQISVDNSGDPEALLSQVLHEVRRLKSIYGDVPSIIIIDKTGRYGLLPMILPGQAATLSLAGDTTEKKWLEFWTSLDKFDETTQYVGRGIFEDVRYFAQMGVLAAATQPVIHLHPVERLKEGAVDKVDSSDKPVLERLDHGEFGPKYISRVIDEIYIDKFLYFVDLVDEYFVKKCIPSMAPHITSGGLTGSLNESLAALQKWADKFREGAIDEDALIDLISRDLSNHIGLIIASVRAFCEDPQPPTPKILSTSVSSSDGGTIFAQAILFPENASSETMTLDRLIAISNDAMYEQSTRDRAATLAGTIERLNDIIAQIRAESDLSELESETEINPYQELLNSCSDFLAFRDGEPRDSSLKYLDKKKFWAEVKTLDFPRSRLVISSAFMRSISAEIEAVIAPLIQDIPDQAKDRLEFNISSVFDGDSEFPGVRIIGTAEDIGLHAKEVSAAIDHVMNKKWGELFEIIDSARNAEGEDREAALKKLDDAIGLSETIRIVKESGVAIEPNPGFFFKRAAYAQEEDNEVITKNYLNYMVDCFDYAARGGEKGKLNPEIHNSAVCPRGLVFKKTEDGRLTYSIHPNLVFEPVASMDFLRKFVADWASLKKVDARLRNIKGKFAAKGIGGDGFVSDFIMRRNKKKSFVEGDYVFHILRQIFESINNSGTVPRFFKGYVRKELLATLGDEGKKTWKKVFPIIEGWDPDKYHTLFEVTYENEVDTNLMQELHVVLDDKEKDCIDKVIKSARNNTLRKFVQSESAFLNDKELEVMQINVEKKMDSVREAFRAALPDLFDEDETLLEERYFFQLAVERIMRVVCSEEYRRPDSSRGIMEKTQHGFVQKTDVKLGEFYNEEYKAYSEQITYYRLARYIIEQSLISVLGARDMDDIKEKNAKFVLIEEIGFIIELIAERAGGNGNLIDMLTGDRGEENFKDMLQWISEKLRRRGYMDEMYYKMLSEEAKGTQGHVGMIKDCNFDISRVRELAVLSDDVKPKIKHIIKEAADCVYRTIDPAYAQQQ